VCASHLSSLGPSVRLTGRDGKHIDNTLILENRVSNVCGKPPVNAVAVEQDCVIDRSGHLKSFAWNKVLEENLKCVEL
jgi:hypothetical protein